MNTSLLPDPVAAISGHPACSESRVRGMQPCRNERHSPQYTGAIFFSTGQPTTTPISATSRGASSRHGTWGDTRCGFPTARASSQPLLSNERELALPSKRAVWVLVTTRTIGVCCSIIASRNFQTARWFFICFFLCKFSTRVCSVIVCGTTGGPPVRWFVIIRLLSHVLTGLPVRSILPPPVRSARAMAP